MIALEVDTSNFNESVRKLAGMPDIIRKAVTGALSETVDDLHTRQTLEMKQVFNNPTPYVLRGLKKRYPGGKMGRGVGGAGTYFEFFPVGKSPEDIVKPHVFGGPRRQKSSERRLGGRLLSPFTVMGRDYPRNASGDIPGARYTQMLNQLDALSDVARSQMPKSRQKNRAGVSYFVMVQKGGKKGSPGIAIAERRGSQLKIMLVAARSTGYGKSVKYDYFGVGRKQAEYSLPVHFNRIVQRYMSRM